MPIVWFHFTLYIIRWFQTQYIDRFINFINTTISLHTTWVSLSNAQSKIHRNGKFHWLLSIENATPLYLWAMFELWKPHHSRHRSRRTFLLFVLCERNVKLHLAMPQTQQMSTYWIYAWLPRGTPQHTTQAVWAQNTSPSTHTQTHTHRHVRRKYYDKSTTFTNTPYTNPVLHLSQDTLFVRGWAENFTSVSSVLCARCVLLYAMCFCHSKTYIYNTKQIYVDFNESIGKHYTRHNTANMELLELHHTMIYVVYVACVSIHVNEIAHTDTEHPAKASKHCIII